MRAQLLQPWIHAGDVDACALSEEALHLEDGGEFLFGEQIDLQIEMGALVGLLRHMPLGHQDEARQHDRLERDRERQQTERVPIEGGVTNRVHPHPHREPQDVRRDENRAAGKTAHAVDQTLQNGASVARLPLEAHDGLNIRELRSRGAHRVT